MPAINQPYSLLVFRYSADRCRGLPTGDNIWDSFPFNNERFCSWAGIEVGAGLSQPPGGALRDKLSKAAIKRWPEMVKGGVEFLKYCDAERRKYGKTVTMEEFQRVVLQQAPKRNAWTWLVDTLWNLPGGLGDRLIALARDQGCDAEEAYRADREEKMAINEGDFEEAMVTGTKFEPVWTSTRAALTRAVFGDPSGTGRPLAMGFSTLRAML
ncbi:hypothetical protein FRC11_009912, partial [Ceratobasidium sp. 423]